jgi:hypothetical protein
MGVCRLGVQQHPQVLSAHLLGRGLRGSAQTFVYYVGLLDPHVHGGPEAIGERFALGWKLDLVEFSHVDDNTCKHTTISDM